MIKYVEGNILNATEDVICHQVNCFGKMGAGLAKQIRNKYPKVYKSYELLCKNSDSIELFGGCYLIQTDDCKWIANLFGQHGYGTNNKQTNYTKLTHAIQNMKSKIIKENLDIKSFAIPYKMGCGLAGGDWNIVLGIIEQELVDYNVTIYKYK